MRLFLYEDITGGGCSAPPDGSLLAEGRAMRDAVAHDFAKLGDVVVLEDARLTDANPVGSLGLPPNAERVPVDAGGRREAFRRLAGESDWSLVIAPEFEDRLLERCEDVEAAGGRLLGPDSSLVALCSDKFVLLDHLASSGANTPRFARYDTPLRGEFPFPAVFKPRFGAGSLGVRRIESPAELPPPEMDHCLEEFVAGDPVSIFLLKGEKCRFFLPACRQRLGGASGFEYQGGEVLRDPVRQARIEALAEAVLANLPDFSGHLGIDLVLGEDDRATLIEVNPRLTTSYVGLRRLIDRNLAECMLEVATEDSTTWSLNSCSVSFEADGSVQTEPSPE